MTEQERKLEEIRLLNLRVDELKEQNRHYKTSSDELDKVLSDFIAKTEKIKVEYSLLEESKKVLSGKVLELDRRKIEIETQLNELNESLSERRSILEAIKSDNDLEDKRKTELRNQLSEVETKLRDSKNEFDSKYNSLKGFEEQLSIREALLNRRQEILDLKEQGVKLK